MRSALVVAKLIIRAKLNQHLKNSFLLPALIACLGLMLAGFASAQTFKTLYNFSAGNSDGSNPDGGLSLSGNILYGATLNGIWIPGEGGAGGDVVFAVNTDGTGFRKVMSSGYSTFEGGVIVSSNRLYGTAEEGTTGSGTVFAVNANGSGFTNLHSFTGSDGRYPIDGLLLLGNTLYGTAGQGGPSGGEGAGTVFAVNTDGSGFTNLYSFTGGSDGGFPYAGLISSGNTLYGTTAFGGSNDSGAVFAINTDGSGFSNLHSFSAFSQQTSLTNSDGGEPQCSLVVSGVTLYGTTYTGGTGGNGTIFAINTDGTGFTNLHSFAGPHGNLFFGAPANSDGAFPSAGLLLSGNTLYGSTSEGGIYDGGAIFAINTDGTGFRDLYFLAGGIGGSGPSGPLIVSGNTLYGTAEGGGSYGYGTVFSLSFPPQLAITPSGTNVILTWPTNVAGFDYTGYTLQSTTNLASPSWSAVSPSPVIFNGQETVTNPISGTQMFYRLMQ